MMILIALAGSIYALVLISRHWQGNITSEAQPTRYVGSGDGHISDPELCRQLIRGELTQGLRHNQLSLLQSRATPNQRLRAVFGIENAFTSTDAVVAENFVREARRRINLEPAEWSNLSHVLVDTVRQWIFPGFDTGVLRGRSRNSTLSSHRGTPRSGRINITSLVQALTLKAILTTVCKAEAQDRPDDLAILQLAQQINRGWIQSKKRTETGRDGTDMLNFEQNGPLQASLRAVFFQPGQGRTNPLNFVLPSFETMWRVVFRALLETNFQSGCEHPEWAEAMIAFCREATKAQFEKRPSSTTTTTTTAAIEREGQSPTETPSAKDIVVETLRLYPPTRRIYRSYHWGAGPASDTSVPSHDFATQYGTIAADIEACHLRSDIWGSSAARFDPARWMNVTPEQNHSFMSFGGQPCECPAKAVFGPRMVGILVGALLLVLDEGRKCGMKWTLECGDDQVMRSLALKERLSLERDAYDDLGLFGTWE